MTTARMRSSRPRMEFACRYEYQNELGATVFAKARYTLDTGRGKTFRYQRPYGRGYWTSGKPDGADRYPYRLPELLGAVRGGARRVWVVEGEKDADAIAAAGGVATTMHQGAEVGPNKEQAQWLAGYAGHVLVVVDDDPAGYWCGKRWWTLLVGSAGLSPSQVRFRLAREGKDAADHLAAGYGLGDFKKVDRKVVWAKAGERDELAARRGGYWYPRGINKNPEPVVKPSREDQLVSSGTSRGTALRVSVILDWKNTK